MHRCGGKLRRPACAKASAGRQAGGRKRWAGFNPQNPLDFVQNGFGFRPTNSTNKFSIKRKFFIFKKQFYKIFSKKSFTS